MNRSTACRIRICKSVLADKYEEGRQDRNKGWVLRTAIAPMLGISRRTFSRYINTPDEKVDEVLCAKNDARQLSLFPDY
ncbi:MAG: hypothetical protein K6G73_12845 [Marinilabiliaceae bacterium]|nr:hypothetical protein [Marinilabiliaceae bacterium]